MITENKKIPYILRIFLRNCPVNVQFPNKCAPQAEASLINVHSSQKALKDPFFKHPESFSLHPNPRKNAMGVRCTLSQRRGPFIKTLQTGNTRNTLKRVCTNGNFSLSFSLLTNSDMLQKQLSSSTLWTCSAPVSTLLLSQKSPLLKFQRITLGNLVQEQK